MGIFISFQNKIKVIVRYLINIFILTFLTILNVLPQVSEVAYGIKWTCVTDIPFPKRWGHMSVEYNNKI